MSPGPRRTTGLSTNRTPTTQLLVSFDILRSVLPPAQSLFFDLRNGESCKHLTLLQSGRAAPSLPERPSCGAAPVSCWASRSLGFKLQLQRLYRCNQSAVEVVGIHVSSKVTRLNNVCQCIASQTWELQAPICWHVTDTTPDGSPGEP